MSEKKSMGWYAPAAVALFGLGLYIARKKKIQLKFTDDSNTYKEVDKSSHLLHPTSRISTNLDTSSISNDDLDSLKDWWTKIGKQKASEEPTTLPPSIVKYFLDLKSQNPKYSKDQLFQVMENEFQFR